MRHFDSSGEDDYDSMVVETGSSRLQDGRRRHPHIRPQVGSDEELGDEPEDRGFSRMIPVDELFR